MILTQSSGEWDHYYKRENSMEEERYWISKEVAFEWNTLYRCPQLSLDCLKNFETLDNVNKMCCHVIAQERERFLDENLSYC